MALRRRRRPVDRRPTWLEPMPVRRWMRQPVVTVTTDAAVGDVARLMRSRGLRHLPVTDAAERLVGIVTDRDLRQVVFDPADQEPLRSRGAPLARLPVRRVMTWGVVTVRPTADLREAARLMHERKIGALPVVEGGRVVGILTESDTRAALLQAVPGRVAHPGALRQDGGGGDCDDGFPLPGPEAAGDTGEPS